jgi:hypothetical protein
MLSLSSSSQGSNLQSKLQRIDQAMRLRDRDWDNGDSREALKHLEITSEMASRMPYEELLSAVRNLAEQDGGGISKRRRRKRSKRTRRNKRT